MVNILTIALVHAVLFIAAVRLMMRDDLDADMAGSSGDDGQEPREESRVAMRRARRQAQARDAQPK